MMILGKKTFKGGERVEKIVNQELVKTQSRIKYQFREKLRLANSRMSPQKLQFNFNWENCRKLGKSNEKGDDEEERTND